MLKNKTFIKNFTIILFFAVLVSACGKNETTTTRTNENEQQKKERKDTPYVINTKESSVNWLAKKVTGQHNGTVSLMGGELMIDNGKLSGGKFEIDFKSITVSDLKDEEMNKKLTNHLKSEDFFAADKHPVGAFEITGVTETPNSAAGHNYTVKGNMTIKGITKEISFPAKITVENNKATAEANMELDRTEWDIRYGSGKFFENLGDKMIYDKFNLIIKLSANS